MIKPIFIGLFAISMLGGCASGNSSTSISPPIATPVENTPIDITPSTPSSLTSMNTVLQKSAPSANEDIAVISTNKGDIIIRFFPEEAPKAVENFLGLANKKYYNGVIFHRIIKGFMIQGGDPTGTGRGGESLFGKVFENEVSSQVKNLRGSVAMANAGPDTNGSQFYINHADNLFLDGGYTVFGEVIEGMKVVDEIANLKTDSSDKPVEEVKMEKIDVLKYGEYQK